MDMNNTNRFDDEIDYSSEPAEVAAPSARPASSPVHCNCRSFLGPGKALPLAIRGVCPRCNRPRAATPVVAAAPAAEAPAAPAAFADIAGEAAHNAATQSMAGGKMAGVGFTSAHYYIQAIRNGVTARTHREYITTLRTRFGMTSEMIAGLNLPGPQLGAQQSTLNANVGQVDNTALRAGDLVAGAAAEGNGILLGFSGRGTMTRAQILETLRGAGFPEDWAPRAKSAHAQVGRITGALNSSGYIVRADRSKSQARKQGAEIPAWQGRWYVARMSRGVQVGDKVGDAVLIVTVDINDQLIVEGDETLASQLRAEFDSAISSEVYQASDVSDWLKSVLVSRFRAAKLGGNWYVKRRYAAEAEGLLTAFAGVWGENYMLPALPIATSEQLRTGIADSFKREVDDLIAEFDARKAEAEADGRLISARTASTLHKQLRALAERAAAFAALLGDHHVAPLRAQMNRASEQLQDHMNDVAIRFDLIFDELARDAAK